VLLNSLCWLFRCIDGFSRQILWLRCSYTNHAPGVIGSYFIDRSNAVGGFPRTLRTDCGTENVLIAAIQEWATGISGSHVYGTSPANQCIESWWSFFRRGHSQGWIDVFESMVASGVFQPGHVKQTDCLRFCFMHLVQQDLDKVMREWNRHRIRPTRGARCPAGIPDQLYFLPPASYQNCLIPSRGPLPPQLCDELQHSRPCEDESFMQYLLYLCDFRGWTAAQSVAEAKQLYSNLVPYIWNSDDSEIN